MLPYILFALATIILFITAGLMARSALLNGHRGDYTVPVTVAFIAIVVALWGSSFLLLGSIDFSTLLR